MSPGQAPARVRGSQVLPVHLNDKRPVSKARPQGTGGTSICSKSPLAGEYDRGLKFTLLFQVMIHLGQMMLPSFHTRDEGRLEKASSANFKGVPTLQ